jgi:hypothetical protein
MIREITAKQLEIIMPLSSVVEDVKNHSQNAGKGHNETLEVINQWSIRGSWPLRLGAKCLKMVARAFAFSSDKLTTVMAKD